MMIASGNLLGVSAAMTRTKLSDLLDAMDVLAVSGDVDVGVADLSTDSRLVEENAMFFAVPGASEDGARYVADAISRGASVVVVDQDAIVDPSVYERGAAAVVRVPDVRQAKALAAARFFGDPSCAMSVFGVTGTNGKTTTSLMIRSVLDYHSGPSVLIGSLGYEIGARRYPAPNTTPDSIDIQRLLARGRRAGCRNAVMEVSSHALDQRRAEGVRFQTATFTNLSGDHLDYHKTQEAYRNAKARLFAGLPEGAVAVLNADDPASEHMASVTSARVVRYGLSENVDVRAIVRRVDIDGASFLLRTDAGEIDVQTRLVGRHNLMNAIAGAATCAAAGIPLESIHGGFQLLRRVTGRLEAVDCGQDFRVLVDYAHTDDALRQVLNNLRPLTRGRVITVMGCGGDRDRAKRPRMGLAASMGSDLVVLTDDNPRSEDPAAIRAEVRGGVDPSAEVWEEPDRRKAIERALREAAGGDIVLIAGKGHETEQIVGGVHTPFDDRHVAKEVLWSL